MSLVLLWLLSSWKRFTLELSIISIRIPNGFPETFCPHQAWRTYQVKSGFDMKAVCLNHGSILLAENEGGIRYLMHAEWNILQICKVQSSTKIKIKHPKIAPFWASYALFATGNWPNLLVASARSVGCHYATKVDMSSMVHHVPYWPEASINMRLSSYIQKVRC